MKEVREGYSVLLPKEGYFIVTWLREQHWLDTFPRVLGTVDGITPQIFLGSTLFIITSYLFVLHY